MGVFLVAGQRLDGVELRGFAGREVAENDAGQKGATERDDDGADRENHPPARQRASADAAQPPARPAKTPAKPPIKHTITASARN